MSATTTPTRLPETVVTAKRDPPEAAKETDGSLLWMRQWKLTVGKESGEAVDLSQLGFTFEVSEQQVSSPWQARFMIYNVGDNIIARMQKELTILYFEAGYRKPSTQYGKVFQGPINYYRRGRESATDTFVEIYAMANDLPVNTATINTTLPAGHTQEDVVKAVALAMAPYGVGLGQITELGKEKSPRSRTLYGMAVDVLRDISQTVNANWFLDKEGKLHIIKEDESLKMSDTAIPVLNSKTGMIGVPVQTSDGGVEVRCLLNPSVKPGGQIKINNKDVTTSTQVTEGMLPNTEFKLNQQSMMLASDGIYTVGAVKHTGESRGNAWYTDITTMSGDPNKNAPKLPT